MCPNHSKSVLSHFWDPCSGISSNKKQWTFLEKKLILQDNPLRLQFSGSKGKGNPAHVYHILTSIWFLTILNLFFTPNRLTYFTYLIAESKMSAVANPWRHLRTYNSPIRFFLHDAYTIIWLLLRKNPLASFTMFHLRTNNNYTFPIQTIITPFL